MLPLLFVGASVSERRRNEICGEPEAVSVKNAEKSPPRGHTNEGLLLSPAAPVSVIDPAAPVPDESSCSDVWHVEEHSPSVVGGSHVSGGSRTLLPQTSFAGIATIVMGSEYVAWASPWSRVAVAHPSAMGFVSAASDCEDERRRRLLERRRHEAARDTRTTQTRAPGLGV